MSILSKVKRLSSLARNPGVITADSKYIFILGHMRSRSSVLSHVLGSNEGICGYSELQISYESPLDLLKMKVELAEDLACDFENKYLLDKILHNRLKLSEKILRATNAKVIFLIRDPESTIRSLIHLGERIGVEWYTDFDKVHEYYCSRLAELENYARTLEGNYFFLDSDDLTENSEVVLGELSQWLCLDHALDASYSIFNQTAKTGHGDPLDNIRAGKITQTQSHSSIALPADGLASAQACYEQCKNFLKSNIQSSAI